jgi:CrcB protein
VRPILLVAIGGVIGATLRWGAGELIERRSDEFPWSTLLINVAGCVLIGVAARRLTQGSDLWLILVTGALGGLTTYSAFAFETKSLIDAGRESLAIVYVGITMVAGLAAVELARGDWARR